MKGLGLEKKFGAQLLSIGQMIPENVDRYLGQPQLLLRKVMPGKRALVGALAISGASLAGLMLGSFIHKRSPWSALNATAAVLPRYRARRPSKDFQPKRVATALGAIAVASLALAAFEDVAGKKTGRALRGAIGGVTALAMDRIIGKSSYWPGLKRALGIEGLALTYGAIGAACALSPKEMNGVQKDPSGGDIAAGVPAM
jgi:hypothetical protein